MIERVHPEQLADRRQLRCPAAWAGSDIVVDVSGPHVRRLAFIVQKIDPAYCPHDAAGPGIRTALEQGRWALAAQLLGQLAAKDRIFFVQMASRQRV